MASADTWLWNMQDWLSTEADVALSMRRWLMHECRVKGAGDGTKMWNYIIESLRRSVAICYSNNGTSRQDIWSIGADKRIFKNVVKIKIYFRIYWTPTLFCFKGRRNDRKGYTTEKPRVTFLVDSLLRNLYGRSDKRFVLSSRFLLLGYIAKFWLGKMSTVCYWQLGRSEAATHANMFTTWRKDWLW